jgi:hypothetical protein
MRLTQELQKTASGNLDLMNRIIDRATGRIRDPPKVKRLLKLLEEGRREEMEIEKRLDPMVAELIRRNEKT